MNDDGENEWHLNNDDTISSSWSDEEFWDLLEGWSNTKIVSRAYEGI